MRAQAPTPGRIARKGLEYLHVTGSYLILLIMLWITTDVGSRIFLGRPLPDSRELVSYLLPILVFLQLTFVLVRGQHLRSPIIVSRIPVLARRILAVFGYLLGATFFGLMAYSGYPHVTRAYHAGLTFGAGVMDLPVWIARGVVMLASALLSAAYLYFAGNFARGREIDRGGALVTSED